MKEWDGEGDFSSRTFTLGWKKSGKIPKPLLASRPSPWHSRALTECRRLEELARRSPGPLTHRTLTTSRRQEAHRHRRPRCWSVNRSPHHSVTSNDEGKGEKEGVFLLLPSHSLNQVYWLTKYPWDDGLPFHAGKQITYCNELVLSPPSSLSLDFSIWTADEFDRWREKTLGSVRSRGKWGLQPDSATVRVGLRENTS